MIPTGLETGDSCWVPDVAGIILVCFLLILTWNKLLPLEPKAETERTRHHFSATPELLSQQMWLFVSTVVLQLSHASESPGSLDQIAGSIPQVYGITLGQRDGEIMETVTGFIFLGCKITVDSDCSLKIKRLSLLGRKAMTNLDSALKSRDITLPTKVWIVKAMAFPLVVCRCESGP